jgi:hypothetical protein
MMVKALIIEEKLILAVSLIILGRQSQSKMVNMKKKGRLRLAFKLI